jgi:glycosyltransferase involved in cell wall biosynthesis
MMSAVVPGPTQLGRRVSVVVPVRNEEQSVGELLESLRAQTRKPDEVVICDGGSTDRTVAVAESFANRGLRVRLLRAGPAFPGRARNLAIQAARFDLIALTDAGIRLDPRWLEHLVAPFEGDRPPDVVYGRYEPVHTSFRQRCIGLAFVPPRDRRSGLRGSSVASMAMSHDVRTRTGDFREDLRSGEDLLFMRAISARRLSVRYAPAAVAFWSPPLSFGVMFRRFAAFSHSGMRAGLAREWQLPLFRIYLLMFALALATPWSSLGYLAPVVIIGARAAKRVVRELGLPSLANVPLVVGVMVALGIIDVATFDGCRRWLVADWIPRLCRRRAVRLARSRDSAP